MSVANKVLVTLLKRNNRCWISSVLKSGKYEQYLPCKLMHTTTNFQARVAFNLSDIGEGIREVVVKEWYVKEGDRVAQFDNICEVQSDKASVTITSRYDGVITKLHYPVEQIAYVGKPLVDIETDEAETTSQVQETQKSTPSSPKPVEVESATSDAESQMEEADSTSSDILAIPSVRRIAKEHNLDLAKVSGTGKGGRILKEDILKFLDSKKGTAALSPVSKDDRTTALTVFQKAMVKTMTDSLKIPHFVYSDEISVNNLSIVRDSMKDDLAKINLKLSYMPFFIKATSNALSRYPLLNATLDSNCEKVTYKSAHNIGVAMDTKIGLAVPVIKNVESLTIIEIAKELNRLMTSGKNGIFAPSDVKDGTFTISNIGAIGGTYMKPVILSPQVAIIAIGAIQRLPRFDINDNIFADQIVQFSGAADHRIVDGATMAKFANFLKKQIQNPTLLFMNL